MTPEYKNFHPNRCNICFRDSPNKLSKEKLKFCSKCKLIKYCGKEHQKIDAPIHKDFCSAVHSVLMKSGTDHVLCCADRYLSKPFASANSKTNNMSDLMVRINCTSVLLAKVLGRSLYYHEQQLISFPLLCNVCMEYRAEKLTLCQDCQQTGYCGEEHRLADREKHSKLCDRLRINFLYDGRPVTMPENVYPNMHFNDHEMLQKPFPKDTFALASAMLLKDFQNWDTEPGHELGQQMEELKIAGMFSHVGTILYVLQKVRLLEDVGAKLNIFILGAEKELLLFNTVTQAAFFAFMPNLKHLRLCFIGPMVEKGHKGVAHFAGNRRVEIESYHYLYHRLPEAVNLPKPHLVIAFNCGFTEFIGTPNHTWNKTILKVLAIPNVPFAFTSYTLQEASEDACIVELLSTDNAQDGTIAYVVRNAVNPFRHPVPLRNPNLDDEFDVLYHENGYLSVCFMQDK
ncbi:uncharacterized protein LOC126560417 [Anopheles maculipalpis]|uniref:uncharacterized protein LOC126560417 n=1 Tax=Anopheles maculipalpis TaxID=1496333 RepID=UPI002158C90B|nr:uncharacterized protein LOC126560417 [Anopheles maculipalpis]